jgi:hypothetical protein
MSTLIMILSLLPTAQLAADYARTLTQPSTSCEFVADLATVIMEKRQDDVPFRLMMKAINFDAYGSTLEQKHLARKLALKAYRIPIADTAAEKTRAVDSYRVARSAECSIGGQP